MFRMGGSAEGITSGLSMPRQGYKDAKLVEVPEEKGAPISQELIDLGIFRTGGPKKNSADVTKSNTTNTNSESSNKLNVGDNLILQLENSSFKETYRIINIQNNNNTYTINVNRHITLPSIQTPGQSIPNINWIVNKPKSNLYNSYSYLTSIKDSMQIDRHFDSQLNFMN